LAVVLALAAPLSVTVAPLPPAVGLIVPEMLYVGFEDEPGVIVILHAVNVLISEATLQLFRLDVVACSARNA
jgi:hypothetical protein